MPANHTTMLVDWNPRNNLTSFIDQLFQEARMQKNEVYRAFTGQGNFEIIDPLRRKFLRAPQEWHSMSPEARDKHYEAFLRGVRRCPPP